MDEFFRGDAFEYALFKMGRSYCFRLNDSRNVIICIFTISNDSIRIYGTTCKTLCLKKGAFFFGLKSAGAKVPNRLCIIQIASHCEG